MRKIWKWAVGLDRRVKIVASITASLVTIVGGIFAIATMVQAGTSVSDASARPSASPTTAKEQQPCEGTRIESPQDDQLTPVHVEVKMHIADCDLTDAYSDVALSHCAGPRCYLIDRVVPTGGNSVYKEIEIGTEIKAGESHRYVLRLDRLPVARLDALLDEKKTMIDNSPDKRWIGFEPSKIAQTPIHSITIKRQA